MKLSITLSTLLLFSVAICQGQVFKLSYSDCQDIEKYRTIKNGTELTEYHAQDGSIICLGDTLILGAPTANEITTGTVGAGNRVFGAVSESTTNAVFKQIQYGKPASFGAIMAASSGVDVDRPGVDMQGEQVIVKKMYVSHKGSKKKPLALIVYLGESHGRAFGAYKHLSTSDYEKATLVGELKALNAPMTKSEAMAKLKEQKELLEVGLITAEEFEKIKNELKPIILKK